MSATTWTLSRNRVRASIWTPHVPGITLTVSNKHGRICVQRRPQRVDMGPLNLAWGIYPRGLLGGPGLVLLAYDST